MMAGADAFHEPRRTDGLFIYEIGELWNINASRAGRWPCNRETLAHCHEGRETLGGDRRTFVTRCYRKSWFGLGNIMVKLHPDIKWVVVLGGLLVSHGIIWPTTSDVREAGDHSAVGSCLLELSACREIVTTSGS